ncbi:PEP-CTERM sorting domain-containing protein [Crocosphaera chwakensis]|nr:PEP-CTERM sorting domain-containing protein [Crocosphaera chwakensis]
MRYKFFLYSITIGLLTIVQPNIKAQEIDFNDNPIDFKGFIVNGDKIINQTQPTLKKTQNGFTVEDFTYTVSPPARNLQWQASREFNLIAEEASDVTVSIAGNTRVTLTGGNFTFIVIGGIDEGITVDFISEDIQGPFDGIIEWNKSGIEKDVSPGTHTLDLIAGGAFNSANPNDRLIVSSVYDISASVPEPNSTLSLLALGIVGAGTILKRKLKFSNSHQKELKSFD